MAGEGAEGAIVILRGEMHAEVDDEDSGADEAHVSIVDEVATLERFKESSFDHWPGLFKRQQPPGKALVGLQIQDADSPSRGVVLLKPAGRKSAAAGHSVAFARSLLGATASPSPASTAAATGGVHGDSGDRYVQLLAGLARVPALGLHQPLRLRLQDGVFEVAGAMQPYIAFTYDWQRAEAKHRREMGRKRRGGRPRHRGGEGPGGAEVGPHNHAASAFYGRQVRGNAVLLSCKGPPGFEVGGLGLRQCHALLPDDALL